MYKSLVEPYFRYCCPVWGNAGVTAIEKLQKLQNRAAKLVTNSPFDATALPVIRALKWPTVRELIDFEAQKMVFKSLNGDVPSYMKDMFTRVNNSTLRSLRNAEDLRLPLLKSAGGQKCFAYRGAKLWNNLGTEVRNSSTIRSFKKKVSRKARSPAPCRGWDEAPRCQNGQRGRQKQNSVLKRATRQQRFHTKTVQFFFFLFSFV